MKLKIRLINAQKSNYQIQFEPNTHIKELAEGEEMIIEVEKRGDLEPLIITIDDGTLILEESDDVFLEEML